MRGQGRGGGNEGTGERERERTGEEGTRKDRGGGNEKGQGRRDEEGQGEDLQEAPVTYFITIDDCSRIIQPLSLCTIWLSYPHLCVLHDTTLSMTQHLACYSHITHLDFLLRFGFL